MRIQSFKIENFKNIRLAEYDNLPDFIVICGGNGCGKSSILEALMTAKEILGSYGYFQRNRNCVSADADFCEISIHFIFTDREITYLKEINPSNNIANDYTATIHLLKDGGAKVVRRSDGDIQRIFSRFSANKSFFDFFSAHRNDFKSALNTWNADFLNEDSYKRLLSIGDSKFQNIKQYLTGLKISDLQKIQKQIREGNYDDVDSLKIIREFFNSFFAPMEFDDVYLDTNPFKFSIKTPRGIIDIDELSSGEKEILNTYIHFHQLKPKESIILFDEPDVHLHPELERRYLRVLRSLSEGNQMIITTHAPEMMIESGSDSLFTVEKYPHDAENQFRKVSTTDELHNSLSIIMGSKGFVSLNSKIVFVEGEESSTDVEIYEHFFPSNVYNTSFIPAGDSNTVKFTASRVNTLLSSSTTFQNYFCIIDGDLGRHSDLAGLDRIFQLPCYHVENFLLDEVTILKSIQQLTGKDCPLLSTEEVAHTLKELALSDHHLLPFTRALLDKKISEKTKVATDLIFQKKFDELAGIHGVAFESIKDEAKSIVEQAIQENRWKEVCKGRDIIKSFCHKYDLKYLQFRNLLISNLNEIPTPLQAIIDEIAD